MKDLCAALPIVFGRKTGLRSKVHICFFFACYLRCKIQCGSKINVNVIYSLVLSANYLMVSLPLITLELTSVSMQKKHIMFDVTDVQVVLSLILHDGCEL